MRPDEDTERNIQKRTAPSCGGRSRNGGLELAGKTALVTGASRGLGRGIASVLAEKGANVAINWRSDDAAAESLAQELRAQGTEVLQ